MAEEVGKKMRNAPHHAKIKYDTLLEQKHPEFVKISNGYSKLIKAIIEKDKYHIKHLKNILDGGDKTCTIQLCIILIIGNGHHEGKCLMA